MLKWLAIGAAAIAALPLALIFTAASDAIPAQPGKPGAPLAGGPSVVALQDIPAAYLVMYVTAARSCPGLPWAVLAGIGKVESDHGRSPLPGVRSGANYASAEGPMQFLPATFALYATDGDHDGQLSPYDPADAIATAATMLCADGAKSGTAVGLRQAIFAYNHSWSYVSDVVSWAARYTVPAPSPVAAKAIAFALAQVGKPYVWGATGPAAYDCSGLVYAAYAAAGVRIARATFGWRQDGPKVPLARIEPGDLLFSAGSDGTTAMPGHVVMYLGGGLVIQAPQTGQDVQVDPLTLAGVVVATRPADLPARP